MLSQDPKNLQNSSEVTFYMLNNNFPYTQVASAHVRDNTDAIFSFSYSAKFDIFDIFLWPFFNCCLFFSSERFLYLLHAPFGSFYLSF